MASNQEEVVGLSLRCKPEGASFQTHALGRLCQRWRMDAGVLRPARHRQAPRSPRQDHRRSLAVATVTYYATLKARPDALLPVLTLDGEQWTL